MKVLIIFLVVTYIVFGFTLMVWHLDHKATMHSEQMKMIEWNEFLSNVLLLGNKTKTEIAQLIMDRNEILMAAQQPETLTEKWHNSKLYQWLKKICSRNDSK